MNAPVTWTRDQIRNNVRIGKSMKNVKLTLANLAELKSSDRDYFVWSADLPGFGVRVSPSGHRSWIVQFRLDDGRSVRRTIGNLKVVPVSLAEPRAREILASAKIHKVDLVAQERADAVARIRRRDSTIKAIVAAYCAEPETKAKRSYPEIRRYLQVVWQGIHDLDAETCSRHDLIAPLRRIATERGGTSANRAKASLSACFTWAITHGLLRRDNLPTAFLPTWAEKPRERALSIEELGLIWQAAPVAHETFGRMIRLLILTGCRRSEISDLSWGEIDLGRAVIELPGARCKNGLPLTIPLAPAAVAILASVPRLSTASVFTGFRSWSWAKQKLDDMLGLPAWVIHDIRRSVSTGLHEHLNADTHLIELVLNHASGSRGAIAGVYDRSQRLGERRDLLIKWAELVTTAAGEPTPAVAANVVVIGRAGR